MIPVSALANQTNVYLPWITAGAAVLAALGIGSIVTTTITLVTQARNAEKTYARNEKKEAYAGLLSVYKELENNDADLNKTGAELIYWVTRIQLVGSAKVVQAAMAADASVFRKPEMNKLIAAMRDDLGVDTGKVSFD